ncbi:hypothetical protein ASD78_08080 [Lysobacter sp. Root667]|uniref:hypothetical protein n=1 Tax=Lysobacter sp. Root667 TaxID=1736581 RepID=UPI0006F5BE34|nr:hypothetical protein [Lysobacter sp. Root667]KRA75907.1 hypothetical protein ASD78_08080 [Lysobacter sp. Root667]
MSKIAIPDLVEKLAGVAAKPLKDSSVKTELLDYAKGVDTTAQSGSIKAVFGASAAAAIHLYNSADDADEDGVIGSRADASDPAKATTDWRPQLAFQAGSAWLKYSLAASATAKATGKIGTAGGSIAGDRSLRLLCYKRHDAGDRIGDAILSDIDEIASVLSASDIATLEVGEAVALKARGKLTATLSVSWSDIFSTSLHGLADVLGASQTGAFLVNIGASAGASFTATVDDDFSLCFVREKASGERAFRVALRKSVVHDDRFEAKAGVQIEFADPAAVEKVLSSVMAGVLDAPTAALKAIDDATSLDRIPEQYQPIVTALAERFGLEDLNPLQPLKKKLQELTALLSERIAQIAKTKVALGFTYEYTRLASEASLLEATLSEEALSRLHGALLAFDFARVLNYGGSGYALDFYLHQKTVERVRAWGFSLGVGTWFNLKSKQERKDRFVSRRYVSPAGEALTRAYLGSTQYSANANTWNTDYGATFKADLEEARAPQQTAARDFKCGLQLWWEESRIKTASELPRVVDDAVLWGVIDAAAAPALHAQLHGVLGAVGECKPRLSLMLSDHGLRQAMRVFAQADDAAWARHVARALPWYAKQSARASCASREAVYAPLFEGYRRRPDASGTALKQLIAKSLRDYGGGLAGQESIGETPWTVYQVLLRSDIEHRRFWNRWERLRSGATRMTDLLDVRGDWNDFDDNFAMLRGVFEQTFLIRAAASLLASELPASVNDGRARAATLTIAYRDGNQDKSLVVGGRG